MLRRHISVLLAAALLPAVAASCGGGGGGGGNSSGNGTPSLACDYPLPVLHYCTEFFGPTDPNNNGCVQGGGTIVPACSKVAVAGTCKTTLGGATYLTYVYGNAITQQAVASACPNGVYTAGYDGGTSTTGSDGGVTGGGGGGSGSGGNGDAGAVNADAGATCNSVVNRGGTVTFTATLDGGTPPTPQGGTIVAGTYLLTAQAQFGSPCAGVFARSTLALTTASSAGLSGTLQFADELASPNPGTSTSTYTFTTTAGATSLALTNVCFNGQAQAAAAAIPIGFSSGVNTLVLSFNPSPTCVDVETLVRQ